MSLYFDHFDQKDFIEDVSSLPSASAASSLPLHLTKTSAAPEKKTKKSIIGSEASQSQERMEQEEELQDRRVMDIGPPTGLERRRGPGLRRSVERRSAEEGEMTDDQMEFVLAIDTYKRLNGRPFPSWTEILEIVKQLGYRKVAASSITLPASSRSQAQSSQN